MELDMQIREAVSLALLEIEHTISNDLKEKTLICTNMCVLFKKQKFIRFAISFIGKKQVLKALDYFMPVLLWDIEREEIVILQRGRNEESKIDYKSALNGTMLENYLANKDNMIIEKVLIYPANSIT